MKIRKIHMIPGILLIATVVVTAAVVLPGKANVSALTHTVESKTVKVMRIETRNSHNSVIYPGTVQAHRKVDLAFQVSGPLVEMNAGEGSVIRKGTLIAKIDPRNYEYNLQAAKAQYDKAVIDYNRIDDLFAQEVVTKNELEQAKTQMDMTESQYKTASKALDDTRLIAPFSGVVCRRYVEDHQNVMATAPIVCLQDMDDLDVVIDVPETDVEDFLAGKGRFVAVLRQGAENEVTVKMREYIAEADEKTKTYVVKMKLSVPDEMTVLPGMSVDIRHEKESNGPSECIIPVSAVVSAPDNGEYVWVLDEETKRVARRTVTVEGFENGHLRVIEGLDNGDVIVTAGASLLSENTVVRVIN